MSTIEEITVVHSYWCNGCDRQYEGLPHQGWHFESNYIIDTDGWFSTKKKVITGVAAWACHDMEEACWSTDYSEKFREIECKGWKCTQCGAEYLHDNDTCYEHDWSDSEEGRIGCKRSAEGCCGKVETPEPGSPEVTVTDEWNPGDQGMVTLSGAEGTPWSAGTIITITRVSSRGSSGHFGLEAQASDGVTWSISSSHVKKASSAPPFEYYTVGQELEVTTDGPNGAVWKKGDVIVVQSVEKRSDPQRTRYIGQIKGGSTPQYAEHRFLKPYLPPDPSLDEKFIPKEASIKVNEI